MRRWKTVRSASDLVRIVLALAALGACGAAWAADEIHWTITGPTSVTFDWRGLASENSIAFGPNAGSYDTTVTAVSPTGTCVPYSSAGPFFEAKLTGLSPDTLYHYAIAGGPDHTFRTPPQPGASGFEVLVEGDIGDSSAYVRVPVIQGLMAEELNARFALMVGDLAYANTNGQSHVDQHFNDVMVWSRDVAYMPAWGNHEWDDETYDDLRNYKGRFDFVNAHSSPGTPAVSDCGEDWYWFDYGNVRFIAYPEPWLGAWADWNIQAVALMDAAQSDPNIAWIVTYGHRPAYSTGNHPGSPSLKGYLDAMAASHSKYVLNLDGHSHNYERTFPQDGSGTNLNGATHVTLGTGGSTLQTTGQPCPWFMCDQPSWSAARYFHTGYLKLTFQAKSITGAFVCGPASSLDDVTCAQDTVLDSFIIGGDCHDSDHDGYGDPGSSDCPMGPARDCNDNNSSVYPGAPQVCDGLNNNCSAPGWPSLAGTNEVDNDGDGQSACAGDCDDTNAGIRHGAPETCDGRDNQCPGDQGYGLIDETSGVSGFASSTNPKTEYSWPPVDNATGWEVARATSPDFSLGCGTYAATGTSFTDSEVPPAGQGFYYLNRPVSPFVGSFGAHSSGVEWGLICADRTTSSVSAKITASSDDAEQDVAGSMRLTSGDLDLTLDVTYQTVGMRFNGLAIPHGAKILSANIQFTVRDANANGQATNVTVRGQSADNPTTFLATHGDLDPSSRPRTAAAVSWNNVPNWPTGSAAGPDQRTPDLSAILREIVIRPGWVSGNSIVVIISGTGDRSARSWDYDSGNPDPNNHNGVPVLHVDFDAGDP